MSLKVKKGAQFFACFQIKSIQMPLEKKTEVPRGANTAACTKAFDSKEAPASIFTSSRNTDWKSNTIVKLYHLF